MDETLIENCEHLIEKDTGGSVSAFIAKINGAHAAHNCLGPCTSVWTAGSLAVRCKTCQKSNTSAICIDCFKAGNHEGHDFSIYASPAGGACDCGDLSSFSYEGCCPRHRPAPSGAPPQGPAPSLPDLISAAELRTLTLILSVALARLTLAATTAADPTHPRRANAAGHVTRLSKFLSGFVGLTPVRPLACQLVMSWLQQEGQLDGPPCPPQRKQSGSIDMSAYPTYQINVPDPPQTRPRSVIELLSQMDTEFRAWVGDSSAAGSAQLQRWLEHACRGMQALLAGIAGRLCGDMHPSMLAVLLRQLPHVSSQHKQASVDLTTFLLLLLYDTDCKHYTSVHILACYPDFLSKVMVDALPHHPLTTALDRLTVQLFNSEEVTYRLTCESSLLQVLVDMLYNVTGQVLDVLNTKPTDQAHDSGLLSKSKVLWHCHRRVQGDLNSVLHYPKVAAAFITLPDVRYKFLACMERAQCMMRHYRKTGGEMVPMPSFKVQCALNLEVVLLSTVPEVEGVLGRRHSAVDSDGQHVLLLHQAASEALLATFQWATGGQSSLLDAMGASKDTACLPSKEMGQSSRSSAAPSETQTAPEKPQHPSSRLVTGLNQLLPLPQFLTNRFTGGRATDGEGGDSETEDATQPRGSSHSTLPPTRVSWEALLCGGLGVSAHLPLHRTFAGLVSALINCEHAPAPHVAATATSALQDLLRILRVQTPLPVQIARQPPKFAPAWQHMQRHVLLLQCFFTQVRLRLWILNGDDIAMLDAFYQGFRELRDLDLLLLQLSMAAGPPAGALVELLYGLGAGPLLHSSGVSHSITSEPTAQHLADKRRLRACECALQLLLVLLRDRITCGAPKARVRQLLLQWLAIKDTGHAQLVQDLPMDLQQACGPYIDEVLKELAVYRSPSLSASGKYMLKSEAWRSFDPNSSLYTPSTKQKALERAGQAGFKPHWSLSPPGPLPPSLEPMRAVLATPEVYMLVHHILAQAVSPSPLFSSEDLTLSALNLLALQLHYTKELIAQSIKANEAGDSSSTSTSTSSFTKEVVSLTAVALQGGSYTTIPRAVSFGSGILPMLIHKAGPAAAAAAATPGAQQSGPVDDVTDCCAYLAKLAQEVLSAGRVAGLLPGAAAPQAEQSSAAAAAAVAQAGDGSAEGDAGADLKARAKARQAEAMAKLRAQQAAFLQAAGEGDSDTDMEPGPAPAHAAAPGAHTGSQAEGVEAMDEDMTGLEELLGLASSSHPAPLMQNQQQQQQQQEEEARPLHGRWGPWTGPAGSSSDGECVVCKQAGSKQEPLGWLGHVQTSGTLVQSLLEPRKWDEDTSTNAPLPPSTASDSCSSLSQQWASCVAKKGPWAGSQADWAPGLHILCCGHQMHARCFEAQRQRSLVLAATGLVVPASMHASIRHREVTCPVCRRLGNVLLPAADFIWQPRQPLNTTTTSIAAIPAPSPSVSLPPPPPTPPSAQLAPCTAAEGRMLKAVFGHMAPLAQGLVDQARLEGDLYVSSLGAALKRRAAMVEHSSTEAPFGQPSQEQASQTPQQQPIQATQQQPTQASQRDSQPQQQTSPQHTTLMQQSGSSSSRADNAQGGGARGPGDHDGTDEDMQEAHPAVDADGQADQATPQRPQDGWAAAAPWACVVKCSAVVEARDTIYDGPLPQLLWAALAHNVAHWEAMHRPLAAAPASQASCPCRQADVNPSSSKSTTISSSSSSSSSSNQGGLGLFQGQLLSQAGQGSLRGAPHSNVTGSPSLPVVDTAHWRGVRGLAGMCMALGCCAQGDTDAQPLNNPPASSSSGSFDRGLLRVYGAPFVAQKSARKDLRDALCSLFGADQGTTNTDTTTTSTASPQQQQQQQQQQQALQGDTTPLQVEGHAPVAISSGCLPRYDTAFATTTLLQQARNPDSNIAHALDKDAAIASSRVLQHRAAETWSQLVPDSWMLLLELLALAGSVYGGEGRTEPDRAHAGADDQGRREWRPLESGTPVDVGHQKSSHLAVYRSERAGGEAASTSPPSSWPSAAPALSAEADAMESTLAQRATSSHGLLAGLVDILLPMCTTQAAAWAYLSGATLHSVDPAAAGGVGVGLQNSLSSRALALFLPWLLVGGRACSGSMAASHSSADAQPTAAAHTAAGVDTSPAAQRGTKGGAACASATQAEPLENTDAELTEVVAVQVLPFLVRAHVLLYALQPHGQPDDGLLQAYATLHLHNQPPQQQQQQQHMQQQPHRLASAHSLADRLCASVGVGGLVPALDRGLTAVGAPPPRLSTSSTPEVLLNMVASNARLHRWCGHLPWAFLHANQPSSSTSTVHEAPPVPLPPAAATPTAMPIVQQGAGNTTSSNTTTTSSSNSGCVSQRCPLPAPPSLIALPPLFQDLLLFFAGKVCTHCKQLPEHPCLCLVTGQLLCSWWTGCVKGRGGGTLHSAESCTGSTLMLSLKSTKVVALRGPRIIVVQSPYLDAHGEEDPELRRGRPLYLQPSIYAHLSKLWSSAALDYDSVLLHSSRSDLDLL